MKAKADFVTVEKKMKRAQANRRMVAIAAVIAGIFVPRLGVAEYDSLPSTSSSVSLGRVESALNPAASSLTGAAGKPGSNTVDNIRAELAEKIRKGQQAIEESKKETALRNKIGGWTEDIQKLKTGLAIPDILADRRQKDRDEKTKQLQGLFASMPASAQGVSAQALDTSKLGDACRTGLDFSQFRALLDQLKSEPFQYLKREGTKIVEDRNEESKKKKIEIAQKLAKHFEDLSKQPVGAVAASQEGAQQDITKAGAKFTDRDNSLAVRLAGLEKTGEAQKKEIAQLRQELVKKVFTDLLPQLSAQNEDDSKLAAITGNFAQSAIAMVRAAKEKGVQGASRATSNCNAIAERMGRGNPLAPGTLFNAAYQWVSTINDTYANQEFFRGVQQASSKLKCSDVSANVEQLLGQDLENQIQLVAQVKEPKQAIEGAMQVMNLVGTRLAQVGDVIQPALRDCKRNEDTMKKVEQFVQGVQQQNSQLAQQQQGAQGGGNSRRSGASSQVAGGGRRGNRNGGPATHSNLPTAL